MFSAREIQKHKPSGDFPCDTRRAPTREVQGRQPGGGGLGLLVLGERLAIVCTQPAADNPSSWLQESARFNTVVTMVNLAVVVFVVCAGMPYAAGSNFKPFAPFGAHGVCAPALRWIRRPLLPRTICVTS